MNILKRTLPLAAILAVITISGNAEAATVRTTRTIVQPAYDEQIPDGSYCREYTQTFSIAGEKETGYGTACLQPDGSWQIASPTEAEENRSDANYVVRDEQVYVQPRTVIFAPGNYWHRRPVNTIYIGAGRNYPPYHGHRHWR